jgi:molecular chaperone DnaJ
LAERPDYYAVLGVDRDATELAIRAAYRRLVLSHHPDRHPDDPDATLRLRNLVQAYETLGDADARQAYDAGSTPNPVVKPGGPIEELLGRVVDAVVGTRNARSASGRDHQYRLTLSLERAGRGCTQTLELPWRADCTRCEGRGFPLEVFPSVCQDCQGAGAIEHRRSLRRVLESCAGCSGQGYVVSTPCVECAGTGSQEIRRSVTIDVPAGVVTGSRLVVKGAGQAGSWGGATGDCFVIVKVAPHPVLSASGRDVLMRRPVTALQALTGGWLTVPTLDGSRRLQLPPSTMDQAVFRLAGLGIGADRAGRGDQLVTVEIEFPVSMSDETIEALKRLDAQAGSEVFPRTRRFEQTHPHAMGDTVCSDESSSQ